MCNVNAYDVVPAEIVASGAGESLADKLNDLQQSIRQGLISEDEYNRLREGILNNFSSGTEQQAVNSRNAMMKEPHYQIALRAMQKAASLHTNAKVKSSVAGWYDGGGRGWAAKWPLHRACMMGQVEEVYRLLAAPITMDPNQKMTDWFDSEPLGWAASFNQIPCIVALIEAGADPRRRANSAGNTPMADAARENHAAAAEVLEAFLFTMYGNVPSGEGARPHEYGNNYARILLPIVGHPGNGRGAYTEPIGLFFFTENVNERKHLYKGG